MSFFLIVAALMLTGLLFVFGIQQRAEEMGILLATGWAPGKVRRLFLVEGGAIAFLGSVAGAWLGTGYTRLLIHGLSSYWKGAVANSAIQYFSKPETVVTGAAASFICALAAVSVAMWRQAKHPARELLQADFSQPPSLKLRRARGVSGYTALGCGLGAIGVVVYALAADLQSITMPFFGAGALLLASGILFCRFALRRIARLPGRPDIRGLALRNVARRHGRSLTVIGLLACGCFLVFAVSSMKEDMTAHADEPWSGTGGFSWVGESTLPIGEMLGDVRLRVRDGDDAGCLNLNRALSPRLLGVDADSLSGRRAFLADEDVWALLNVELPNGEIPALVGDSDTAMWGLEAQVGLEQGDVLEYRDEAGRSFKIRLVGMLPMRLSVFQGSILISEDHFVERFPGEEGYRMFLWSREPEAGGREQGAESREQGAGGAESGGPPAIQKFERSGLDVVRATDRLLEFYAVESTYLTLFLVLGVLGLAVGSMGMGVVVLRNVQGRRAELALLRALGYRTVTLRKLLVMEHAMLLGAGLLIGLVASAVAMVPVLLGTLSRLPYSQLFGLLLAVGGCGIVCMLLAINTALRGDALAALRNE
jgi:hypothetical protein